jgi:hypothetical protein
MIVFIGIPDSSAFFRRNEILLDLMAPFFVAMRRVGPDSETDAHVDWTDILCRQEAMRSADVSSVA